jgi:hypothetical protein
MLLIDSDVACPILLKIILRKIHQSIKNDKRIGKLNFEKNKIEYGMMNVDCH